MKNPQSLELLHEQNLLVAEIITFRLGRDSVQARRLSVIDRLLSARFDEELELELELAQRA